MTSEVLSRPIAVELVPMVPMVPMVSSFRVFFETWGCIKTKGDEHPFTSYLGFTRVPRF